MIINLLLLFYINLTSIYSFNVTTLNKGEIHFQDYTGKKILLVNIATQGQYTEQLNELERLQGQMSDQLVIIAFPSNTYGNESHTNESLSQTITDSLQLSFPVAEISEIKGDNAIPVYKWLSDLNQNGVMNGKVVCDFQKFLINADGKIIGVFRDEVSPLDQVMIDAINNN